MHLPKIRPAQALGKLVLLTLKGLCAALVVSLIIAGSMSHVLFDLERLEHELQAKRIYALLQHEVVEGIHNQILESDSSLTDDAPGLWGEFVTQLDIRYMLDQLFTPAWLQQNVESNLAGFEQFMRGSEDELDFKVDLKPLKDRLELVLRNELGDAARSWPTCSIDELMVNLERDIVEWTCVPPNVDIEKDIINNPDLWPASKALENLPDSLSLKGLLLGEPTQSNIEADTGTRQSGTLAESNARYHELVRLTLLARTINQSFWYALWIVWVWVVGLVLIILLFTKRTTVHLLRALGSLGLSVFIQLAIWVILLLALSSVLSTGWETLVREILPVALIGPLGAILISYLDALVNYYWPIVWLAGGLTVCFYMAAWVVQMKQKRMIARGNVGS